MFATALISSLGGGRTTPSTLPFSFRSSAVPPPVRPRAAVPPSMGSETASTDEEMMTRLRAILLQGQPTTEAAVEAPDDVSLFGGTFTADDEAAAEDTPAAVEQEAAPTVEEVPSAAADFGSMKYKELQAECKRLGLKANGKKDVLIA
eukprot:CAMPEP_0205920958 /NCGR_PEP_ID=MMETSP1325-20131115/12033_1 /ASSEMBLY_ACC=CAM_ASM_000708 /TAXON_ID=236786 /ORGANISM="Florenciella sp., Strain RCC1007" /LENGTH=147 /DNA_ID=CAMNT_0053288707 /DNA_START=74 /DNA_END=514 /DNA_ORIENTATION=-